MTNRAMLKSIYCSFSDCDIQCNSALIFKTIKTSLTSSLITEGMHMAGNDKQAAILLYANRCH